MATGTAPSTSGATSCPAAVTAGETSSPAPGDEGGRTAERRRGGTRSTGGKGVWTREERNGRERLRVWARGFHRRREDALGEGQLRIEFPLFADNAQAGRLVLIKNLTWEPIQPFTLRRVEYLRRSLVSAFVRLK